MSTVAARSTLFAALLALFGSACEPLRLPVDAGDATDATADADGQADAAPSDLGIPDLGPADLGSADGGVSDGGIADASADGGADAAPRTHRVTILRTGEGEVTSTPTGLRCGATCEADFPEGSEVSLAATPSTGYELVGWGGALCAGSACVVRVDRDLTIAVSFVRLRFDLGVTLGGLGSGRVASTTAGIDCGADCDETYDFGAVVTLLATPDGSSTFGGWGGDCQGLAPSCTLTMDQARTAVALFDRSLFSLTVQVGGTGTGRVTASAGAIDCPGTCSDAYLPGTMVTLTAHPSALSRFDGWVGAGCSGTGTCRVTMSSAAAVTAIFTDISAALTILRAGSGTGAVTSNPVGIACGATCTEHFLAGQSLRLIATPDPGSRFSGWTGPCAGQGATCDLVLAASQTITATFEVNRVVQVALGLFHSCAIITPGVLRCFGEGGDGQLGYGDALDRGDGVGPAANQADVPIPLPAGATISKVAAGARHTCVLLSNGAVRCWGQNTYGQLGYGDRVTRGNTSATVPATDVPLGGAIATDIGLGDWHTCVKLSTGNARCWGRGAYGLLGTGDTNDRLSGNGPNITFAGTPPPAVTDLAVGAAHTCALLGTGRVRCWGRGMFGVLGYGDQVDRGDSAASVPIAGDVPLGAGLVIREISAGLSNTCVRLDTGALRCWGNGTVGQMGRGNTANYGDDSSDDLTLDVPVGASASQIAVSAHTCVRLTATGGLRCWGYNNEGQLGLGDTTNRGDGVGGPPSGSDVPLDAAFDHVWVGFGQTCVHMMAGALRCWGANGSGQLGYGDRLGRGDGSGPSINTNVPLF